LLDGFCGGAFELEDFGGAGDHDLEDVDVFFEHGELGAQGMVGFVVVVPNGVAGFVDFLYGLVDFAQDVEFFLFVDAEGAFGFGGLEDIFAFHGAGIPEGAV